MADPSVVVEIEDDDDSVRFNEDSDSVETDEPGGGVVVQLNAGLHHGKADTGFYKNLAESMDEATLSRIANELFEAITADDNSRKQHLAILARGIDLIGIKLEEPKSSVGESTAGIEGVSSVTNPLLLEACLKSWANARSELLPADGPAKLQVDGSETAVAEDLAERLELDFNHYLTQIASEFYPETSHMLLWGTIFGGSGFKKIYRCPMRRRPVSEGVAAENLIVSDATRDFRSCARITNQITMRPSVMKRMRLLDIYVDVPLTQPMPQYGPIENKISAIQGQQPTMHRPEDQPYTIWESQCELDLDEYAPDDFQNKGIPLPYRVTMDKDSRRVLSIIRDWNEDDKDAHRKQLYVKYPYIPGPGFYGTGMLGLLGNASAAMTAAWREALDAGMFASFPGGLIAKIGAHQDTSDFRIAPGEWKPIATNQMPIQQVAMPMPYRDVTAGLMAMMDKVTAQAQQLGGVADIPASEGLQNVPVGTMLTNVEQATKVMAASHKDMHQALAEELQLLIELFRQNPEDFWRNNKVCPENYWDSDKLLAALDDCSLVPRSDPNTPSHVHRITKAIGLVNLIQVPQLAPYMDPKEVLRRCLSVLREDPTGLLIDPPPQQGGDPAQAIAAQAKMISAQAQQAKVQVEGQKVAAQASSDKDDAAIKAAQLAAEQQIENTRLAREEVIHRNDAAKGMMEMHMQREKHAQELQQGQQEMELARGGLVIDAHKAMHGMHLDSQGQQHDQQMDHANLAQQSMQSDREHNLSEREHGLNELQSEREHGLNAYEATKPEPKEKK